MINVYTDGAYSSKLNQGGLAIVVIKDGKIIAEFAKTYRNTTNNRMELLAVIIAIESLKKYNNVTIFTDSMYVIGCATLGWKKNKNIDLWNRFDKLNIENIKFIHVKGHSDNIYNNRCDYLAVLASQKIS